MGTINKVYKHCQGWARHKMPGFLKWAVRQSKSAMGMISALEHENTVLNRVSYTAL